MEDRSTTLSVGRRVSQYRQAQGLTIQALAERTGLSTALISQLERGIGNPSLSALEALADGLDISLAQLVARQIGNRELICRRADWTVVRAAEGFTLRSLLREDVLHTSLTVLHLELAPHSTSCQGFEVHAEEECLCVLEGALEMVFPDEAFRLEAGDSIRVLPDRRHMLRNDGDAPAVAINIKCKMQY